MATGLRNNNGKIETVTVPEGYMPDWWGGGIYANLADGNPVIAVILTNISNVGITFGDTAQDRVDVREFTLPVSIVAKYFRIFSIAPTTQIWRHAIYRRSDLTKIWDSGLTDTVDDGWNAYSMGDLVLNANIPYWYAIRSNLTTYDANTFRVPKLVSIAQKYYGSGGGPIGNLGIGFPARFSCYVTPGTFPTVLPTPVPSEILSINNDRPIGFITTF